MRQIIQGRQQDQSCRTMLDRLQALGELVVVDEEIELMHDLSALLSLTHDRFAVRADRIRGNPMRVFGNLLSGRERIAMAMDVAVADIQSTLLASVKRPVAPVVV